jgi:UDP-N-acetylglucosamine diphosphorylase/glucosamine-1-phosphate N-acetyltransferase
MRLILFDSLTPKRLNFHPLALSRPIFELRCGMTSLGEKIIAKTGITNVACFVPPYIGYVYRMRTSYPVNDLDTLQGDDLLLVNGRVKASEFAVASSGPSEVGVDFSEEVLYARITKEDLGKLHTESLEGLLNSAKAMLPVVREPIPAWDYLWDLVLANPTQLLLDFVAAGRCGLEGKIEEPHAIRGSKQDVYIAHGVVVHPMVVIDAEHGPVYIDEDAEIQPFTRIEGPCYIGKRSILLGTKCRAGNSIGPMCRVGGEIEDSIIQGYSNKYHDGFLGHAYVGEWVNLGALTTNSDLKNDYSNVTVVLDGKSPISTGSTKVGALIGDHAKTAIGTMLNTGAYVGGMTLIAAGSKLLPKFIPSFAWYLDSGLSMGFGKKKLYEAAKIAMSRRKCKWTPADEVLWDAIHELTAAERDEAIRRDTRRLSSR